MKTARRKKIKVLKKLFLLSKVNGLKLCPLAILMPLDENPYIVPHFEALISCQNFLGGQRCDNTLSLWNTVWKISILLHKWVNQPLWLDEFVHLFVILWSKPKVITRDITYTYTTCRCDSGLVCTSNLKRVRGFRKYIGHCRSLKGFRLTIFMICPSTGGF